MSQTSSSVLSGRKFHQPGPSQTLIWGLPGRLTALAGLFSLELMVLSLQVDTNLLHNQASVLSRFPWGHLGRFVLSFAALLVTFGLITARGGVRRISGELSQKPVGWALLAGHVGALMVFGTLSRLLVAPSSAGWAVNAMAAGWLASGGLALALAAGALLPWKLGLELLTSTRGVWIAAAVGAAVAVRIEDFRRFLWKPTIGLTLDLVQVWLRPLVPDLTVDRLTGTLAGSHFQVTVTPDCSGLEGAGLMLAFTSLWIWAFRRECRFPRVLFLIPASILITWLLNSVRLASLFLIGDAGAPGIAMGGFHSQAGWIVFCGVALGFSLTLNHVPGLRTPSGLAGPAGASTLENPTAWYLMPFLAILAAGMIARAASAGFEWLYPLRFLAAALVLWRYRRRYADLDWRIGWAAPAAGAVVFAMWLGLERLTAGPATSAIGTALAGLHAPARITWIVVRSLAAIITVPIAEELAFRGFLLRRIGAADFEKVDFRRFTFLALLVSSIAFGLMHGNRWLAGTAAGLIYGWALRHRGRMGDAVAAHAITNGLLAGWVLFTGSWQMW